MVVDQEGKENHSGWKGLQKVILTNLLINTGSTDPVQIRLLRDLLSTTLKNAKNRDCTAFLISLFAVPDCLMVKNIFLMSSLLFHFMTTISFTTIASQMLHSAVPRKIIKPCSNLLYPDTTPTSLLSISTTPFLVSFLIPYLHTPSVTCLLSAHPWLLQIIYCVFTAQRWKTGNILPNKALH